MRRHVAVLALELALVYSAPASAAPQTWLVEGTNPVVASGRRASLAPEYLLWSVSGTDGVSPLSLVRLDAAGGVLWTRELAIVAGALAPAQMAFRSDGNAALIGLGLGPTPGPSFGALQRIGAAGALATTLVGPDVASGIGDSWFSGVAATGPDGVAAVGTSGLDPAHAWLVDFADLAVAGSWRYADAVGAYEYYWWLVAAAPGSELYAVGKRSPRDDLRHLGDDPWIVRLASDRAIVWQQKYETGLSAEIRAIDIDPAGGVIAVGTISTLPIGLWLVRVDDQGAATRATTYQADVDLGVTALHVESDGSALIAAHRELGNGVTEPFLLRLDPSGDVSWSRVLDPAGAGLLRRVWIEPDQSCWAVGTGGSELVVASVDAGGVAAPCVVERDVPLFVEDIPTTGSSTYAVVQPLTLNTYAAPQLQVQPAVVSTTTCDCPQQPSVVSGLVAHRLGVDLVLQWEVDPNAVSYNVWTVTAPPLIPLASMSGSPPAIGVVGCSLPNPAPGTSCTDIGAMTGADPEVFYQVRALCGSGFEGP